MNAQHHLASCLLLCSLIVCVTGLGQMEHRINDWLHLPGIDQFANPDQLFAAGLNNKPDATDTIRLCLLSRRRRGDRDKPPFFNTDQERSCGPMHSVEGDYPLLSSSSTCK